MVSPSGVEDDCFISAIDADIYSVRFVPRENGIHYIHVKFNGVHIPGSPFILKVGKDDADPAAVHASGPGLVQSKTGTIKSFLFSKFHLFIADVIIKQVKRRISSSILAVLDAELWP